MHEDWERREFLLALLRVTRAGAVWDQIQAQGLTPGEYCMMDVLAQRRRMPEEKGMYVSELAELLRVSPPAVSRMLRGMERKGYLSRVVDGENRRMTYIVLTAEGEAIQERTERQGLQFAERVADRLGPADTAELVRLWKRLGQLVQEEQAKGN